MEVKADQSLEARLDKNQYDESRLIEMRVPLNLPYQNDWTAFERFDGEVEVDGVHYKYVKRKIEKGQLVVLCIPNDTKMQIKSSAEEYFRMINDLDNDKPGKNTEKSSFAYKGFFNEYRGQNNEWSFNSPEFASQALLNYPTDLIPSRYQRIPGQPPEQA
jgi:hypothetical protein